MAGTENQVFENKRVLLMKFIGRTMTQKDVKNEGRSPEFVENKGGKSAPRSLLKTSELPCFHDDLLKGKEIRQW